MQSRRNFLAAAGLTCAALGVPPVLSAQKKKQPNVLFLFSDDQAYNTIHAVNSAQIKTPNLDKLVKRGTYLNRTFNQGAWNGAVCVASRAMLNSGKYIFNAKEGINKEQLWGETFMKAGYNTFLTGKWHNGNHTAVKSFQYGKAIGQGMFHSDRVKAYNRPAEGNDWTPHETKWTGHWTPSVWDILDGEEGRVAGKRYQVNKHTSELYADSAIEFLETTGKNSEEPFFMYVAFNAPHDPRQAPKKFQDMYPPKSLKIPPNFLPQHPFDQGDAKVRDEKLAPFPRTEYAVQVHLSEYYAIISHMDEEIGRILKALEESGEADNTYIMFTGDHGLAVGSHGLIGKQNQYDHSVRVPMIYCGPGIPKNERKDALVYMQSVHPTSLELAGIDIPESVEFPSLVGLLKGKQNKVHDAVYGAYRHLQRMVRTDRWKLIRYPHNGEVQLFDCKNDPFEKKDLAENPEYADVVKQLSKQLADWQKEAGDNFMPVLKKKGGNSEKNKSGAMNSRGKPVIAGKSQIMLKPESAWTFGSLVYQPDRNNLGAWQSSSDYCEWKLKGVQAGSYRVDFSYGCVNPNVEFHITAGKNKLKGKTQKTGGIKTYKSFAVGEMELAKGEVTLQIKGEKFKGALMNFRELTLSKVEK